MIEFKNVSKTYKNGEPVLKNISLTVPDGEIVVFIGPSGCGKTTSLKMINRLIEPTEGEIFIDGEDISQIDPTLLRRKQGYVVQSIGLFPHMTIKENIEIIPTLQKQDKAEMDKQTEKLMKMVGLSPDEFYHRYPTQLSGGQQQRIGVARAFATEPKLILMDEPFSALDPITRSSLQDELLAIQRTIRKTIVFVTHDMDEAIKIADKICIMNQGEILQYDTPENILKHPADKFVEDFVGKGRIWSQPEFIRAKDICLKNPITSVDDITVLRAVEIMRSERVDSLLIVNSDRQLLGVMSISDIKKGSNSNTHVDSLMHKTPMSVRPDDTMLSILEKFNQGASILPVTDENNVLCGLITRSCLVNTLSQQYITEEV